MKEIEKGEDFWEMVCGELEEVFIAHGIFSAEISYSHGFVEVQRAWDKDRNELW